MSKKLRLGSNDTVESFSEGPVEIRAGITAIFAPDPEGNFIEFVEYADIAAYRPDLLK